MDSNLSFYGSIIVVVLTIIGNIYMAHQNNKKDRIKNDEDAEGKFQERLMKMIETQAGEITALKTRATEQEKRSGEQQEATDDLRRKYRAIEDEKRGIELQVQVLNTKIKELEADKTNQLVKIQELEKDREKLLTRIQELENNR